MSASRGAAAAAGFLGGLLLPRAGAVVSKVVGTVVVAPLVWWLFQCIAWTGDVRWGAALWLGSFVVLWALLRWSGAMADLARVYWHDVRAQRAPEAVLSPADGGPQPESLYRWREPEWLPEGLLCFCGKPRRAGELVYVGISWDVQRRARNEDRRNACWWHGSLVGTVQNFTSREAVEAAERLAIRTEHPRENIAHAVAS